MVEDPYDPEPPFVYECFACGHRVQAEERGELHEDDELVACPECDGELRNVTTPDRE